MAISPLVPGISATILINGFSATEYPDPDDIQVEHINRRVAEYQTRHTVSTYIESISDSPFTLKFAVGPPFGSKDMDDSKIGFEINIDGNEAGQKWCPRPFFKNNPHKTEWSEELVGVKEKVVNSKRKFTERGFRFAGLDTNSDAASSAKVKRLAERLRNVGIIEIKVFSMMYGKKGAAINSSSAGFLKGKERENVPEKAIKGEAKSDCTALGAAKKVFKGATWDAEKKAGPDYPLIIFRFMYRSREALQQLLIIPRTPSSSPSSSRSSSPELDPDHVPGPDGKTPAQLRLEAEQLRLAAEMEALQRQMADAAEALRRARRENLQS
ncbi:hypothetical protein EG329_004837 [Mollisiaceae sp. DMI_Dod_QoI]|nr:hypothetical protein EG329_004837 [Helotiales sp. DMI_Dod_QoI]